MTRPMALNMEVSPTIVAIVPSCAAVGSHFERNHILGNVILDSLNGTGVAITDKAIYYILENGAKLIKYEVPYDYEKVFRETEEKDFPNKDTFKKVISWRKL